MQLPGRRGALSLISSILTTTVALPDIGGRPWSVAVTVRLYCETDSLSRLLRVVIVPESGSIMNAFSMLPDKIPYRILASAGDFAKSSSTALTLVTNDPEIAPSVTLALYTLWRNRGASLASVTVTIIFARSLVSGVTLVCNAFLARTWSVTKPARSLSSFPETLSTPDSRFNLNPWKLLSPTSTKITSPSGPLSWSVAYIWVTDCPIGAFSATEAWNSDLLNLGGYSFTLVTWTNTLALGWDSNWGFPWSLAVTVNAYISSTS